VIASINEKLNKIESSGKITKRSGKTTKSAYILTVIELK
jgi:hypothetical protein